MAICKFNPKIVSQVYFEKSCIDYSYGTWRIKMPRLFVSLSKDKNIKSSDQMQQFIDVVANAKEISDIKGLNFYGEEGLDAVEILYANKVIDSKFYHAIQEEIKHSLIAAEVTYNNLIKKGFYPDKLLTNTFHGDINFKQSTEQKNTYEMLVDMKQAIDKAKQDYIQKQRDEINQLSNFDSNLFIENLKSGNVQNPDV